MKKALIASNRDLLRFFSADAFQNFESMQPYKRQIAPKTYPLSVRVMSKLFLLAASLLLATSAHAQLGVRVGGNFSGQIENPFQHLLGGNSLKINGRLGYQLGLTYRLPLSQHWAVVPELQFSRERELVSLSSDYPTLRSQADYRLNLSYLNVPVLLRFVIGPVYLEAGPQASLLVGGRGQGTLSFSGPGAAAIFYDPVIDQVATERYQRFDAGACVGVGVQLPAGLGLSVRAYQGLVTMDRSYSYQVEAIPSSSSKAYRQTIQGSLTYQLSSFAK
jgi:hypothetical protein